jgi:hypothetical protein
LIDRGVKQKSLDPDRIISPALENPVDSLTNIHRDDELSGIDSPSVPNIHTDPIYTMEKGWSWSLFAFLETARDFKSTLARKK